MAEPLLTSPTLLTSADTAGRFALQATISAAGPCAVTIPHALPVSREATIGFALWLSARPSSVTVTVNYTDPSGSALPPAVATLTADQVNRSVDRWDRQVVHVTAPTGAGVVGTIKVKADTLPASGALRVDEWTIEQGYTDGAYFDGTVLGGQWLGVPELSASVAAPIVTVADGECPLDVSVSYELSNPSVLGGRMTSPAVVLDSRNQTWLTHPRQPDRPLLVQPRGTPAQDHDAEQAVFWPLGATHPVVVSAPARRAPSGTLTLGALSWAERDRLHELLRDLQPVLLRAPGAFRGYDYRWAVLFKLTEDPEGRGPDQATRIFTAPYQEVQPPTALV